MQQVFGKNVKVSLPKSYHSADPTKGKILVFKGVSTNVTIDDFKELLEFNKITHAEAERMPSKRSGRDLPFIKIKCDDTKQAEALISGGFIGQKTDIIFKVEEFRTTPSIQQCFKCQGFGHKAPNCTKLHQTAPKCVVCGEAHSHKNCPNKEKRNPKCANCRGPHVANYKVCPAYKDQAFRQYVVQKQVSYTSILKQASSLDKPLKHNTPLTEPCYRFDKTDDDLLHNILKDSLNNIHTNITTHDELEKFAVTLCDKLMKAVDSSTPKSYSRNDPLVKPS